MFCAGFFWERAHWDAESRRMVAYEKGSKDVLGLGPPDPAIEIESASSAAARSKSSPASKTRRSSAAS
jgi:hypothetical protein